MKKYLIILLSLLCLCLDADLYAQRRNPAKNADLAFGRKQYIQAADRYKKAYKKSKRDKTERARISYQMGECYRLIGLTKRAEPYYRRVLKTDYPNTHPEVYLNLAETYKMNNKFKEALECYEIYAQRVPDDPRGPLGIETTNQIQDWIDNPSRYEMTELKKINSKNSDFGAIWTTPTTTRSSSPPHAKALPAARKKTLPDRISPTSGPPNKTAKANGVPQSSPMKAKTSTPTIAMAQGA